MDGDFSAIAKDDIAWSGHVGTVQYGGDRSMVVMFYNKGVQNPAKSAEAGRPFFEDRVFVRIHPPGERLNIIDRPMQDSDRRRWPMQWAQFKENRAQIPEGTPIDLLYPDQPAIAQTLRASGVHTVESCAELSANAIETIGMGVQRFVNDAQKYLSTAQKGIGATQFRRELEERDRTINSMQHTIDMMKVEMQKLHEVASSRVDVSAVQAAMAGLQSRPTYPPSAPKQLDQSFDTATAQINAVAKERIKKPTKRAPPAPEPRRRRARIEQ